MTAPDSWGSGDRYRRADQKIALRAKLDARRKAAARRSVARRAAIWENSWRELTDEPSIARVRADKAIDSYLAQDLISEATADRGRSVVRRLFDRDTVYTSVAPDTGGLVFYWRAGDMSIEIDLYEELEDGYWWRLSKVAGYCDESAHSPGHLPESDLVRLQLALSYFSKEVERVNPLWRKQYL